MRLERKQWLAGLLSLVVPGLGHLYAGRPRAGGVAFLLSVVALAVVLIAPLFLPQPSNVLLGLLGIIVVLIAIPLHAARTAKAAPQPYVLQPYNRWYLYVGLYLVYTFLIGSWAHDYMKAHLVEAFRIPTASMEPTLQLGDYLYVAKWNGARTRLRHGTVVVFESVEEAGLKVVKRIVGLPGDTLAMDEGALYRNGQRLEEPYTIRLDPGRNEDAVQRTKMQSWQSQYLAAPSAEPYSPDLEHWGPVVVPADSLFVLGDNRDASYDSRYYGFIPRSNVLGQPRVVYFSYDSAQSQVRWGRLGRAFE